MFRFKEHVPLLAHGCEGFCLSTIHDTTSDVSSIHDQPMCFPKSRIVFRAEELPGTLLFARISYEELLDEVLFSSSGSPWGAPVLFFKKTGTRRVELLKDYDTNIQYHPGKANVVADALSRKSGMIAGIKVEEEIIRDLERLDIELCVRGQSGFWARSEG
ncbi:hypothetical protein Tco_0180817 [Tanacetum coccineum]